MGEARGEPKAAVHLHSLGCAKNQLDTEVMIGALASGGYAIAERLEDADAVVVNTCSFIEAAREESIEAILDVADLRSEGTLRALIVAGCLPQRYGAQLAKELPEVDAFVGTGAFPAIASILDDALAGRGRGIYVEPGRTYLMSERDPRALVTATHSAYLKIAEGCDRICAFCAIPGIRGRFQSRSAASLAAEVEQLARAGVRELNVISQDTTSWGKDQPGRPALHALVAELDRVAARVGIDWVRLLYLYPTAIRDELLDVIAAAERVVPYIDVPLQHASDAVLRAMRRGTTQRRQRELVARIRAAIPDVTIRTTLIVGFPGETEADFAELLDFVRELRFERVGVFRYSDEEGTAGYGLSDKVPREVARERHDVLVAALRDLQQEHLHAQVGRVADVLVDAGGRNRAVGRTAAQAPEVDGEVVLAGPLATGALVRARIHGVRGSDLTATPLGPSAIDRTTADDGSALPAVGRSPFAAKAAPQ